MARPKQKVNLLCIFLAIFFVIFLIEINTKNNIYYALSQNETICPKAVLESIVKVSSSNLYGTGILIAKDENSYFVITNAHVISKDNNIISQVVTQDNNSYHTNLVAKYNDDLALLKFSAKNKVYSLAPLATGINDLSVGDLVQPAGFPLDYNNEGKSGNLLCMQPVAISNLLDKPMIQGYQIGYAENIPKGFSGGPLIFKGKVIGINGRHRPIVFSNPDSYIYRDNSRVNISQDILDQNSWAIPIEVFLQQSSIPIKFKPDFKNSQLDKNIDCNSLHPIFIQDLSNIKASLYGDYSNFQNYCISIDRDKKTSLLPTKLELPFPITQLSNFQLIDLNNDKEPEVLLEIVSDQTYRKTYSVIYEYSSKQKKYNLYSFPWEFKSHKLEDLNRDKRLEFISYDTSILSNSNLEILKGTSFLPYQVLNYKEGKLVDVTVNFPKLLQHHAASLWQLFLTDNQTLKDSQAILTSFVLEKSRFNEGKQAIQLIEQFYKYGEMKEFIKDLKKVVPDYADTK